MPAVFIALDPSVSGIPADHEPAVQAMAEDAAKILEDYRTAVGEIEGNTTLSPADMESALLSEKQDALNDIKSIDYLFRAKYGARAWLNHQTAVYREFGPEQ